MPKKVDITEKFIRIRMKDPGRFQRDSFRTINISVKQGIQAIIGKPINEKSTEIQSYLFAKDKEWTADKARDWVSDHKKTRSELLLDNRVKVTASVKLCNHLPNLTMGRKDVDKLETEAGLNDKYYFFSEGVHEGANLNGDFFFRDELTNNYLSVSNQPINWEHSQHEIVGHTVDSQLISEPDKPLAIGFNGVLWRLSPFLMTDNGDGISRDEIVKQRFFQGKLAVSMEALFDKVRCVTCNYETDDAIDFEYHRHAAHGSQEVYRGLVGVDFVGFGMVETPADVDADVLALRTSNDGTLSDLITAEYKEKYGKLAQDLTFSHIMVDYPPDFEMKEGKLVVFSKKIEKNTKTKTKKNSKNDKYNEQEKNYLSNIGGNRMFKLAEIVAEAKSLGEIFVLAQTRLKDYMGENSLTEEEVTAFHDELSEVVKSMISDKDFKVDAVFTLTQEERLDAVTKARDDEAKKAGLVSKEHEANLASKDEEIKAFEATLKVKENELKSKSDELFEIKKAESDKLADAKLKDWVQDIVEAGISLTETMKERFVNLAKAHVDDDTKLDELKNDLLVTIKQSKLIEASKNSGGSSASGESSKEGFEAEFDELHKNHKGGNK